MVRGTSKLQITVPKVLAAELDIRPGDDIDWTIRGNGLRVTPAMDRRAPALGRSSQIEPSARQR